MHRFTNTQLNEPTMDRRAVSSNDRMLHCRCNLHCSDAILSTTDSERSYGTLCRKSTSYSMYRIRSSSLRSTWRSARSSPAAVRSKHTQSALAFQNKFIEIVGAQHVITDREEMEKYTSDWTRHYGGGSTVCFPGSTREVSDILKFCNSHNIGVVPQGGNTGLVGGGVGTKDGELILSMRRMNRIIDLDDKAGVVTCEAGCILELLNNEVGKKGFVIPLDLAAKGSCMIGGNVATNAGGLRVMKYGSLQGNVLGLEVVQADGTVLDMLRTLRKDNCGYHMKNLFVGSEGTLGVITKVSLLLATKPTYTSVVFAKLPSFSKVQTLLSAARHTLGDCLTAFEFMDRNAISAVRRALPNILAKVEQGVLPTPQRAELAGTSLTGAEADCEGQRGVLGEVAVLIECSGTDQVLDQQRVDKFAELIIEQGIVEDAVLSQNAEQEKDLWNIRENLTVSMAQLSRSSNPLYSAVPVPAHAVSSSASQPSTLPLPVGLTGRLFKYDLSVRLQDTDEVLRRLKQRLLQAGFRMKGVAAPAITLCEKNPVMPRQGADLSVLLSACELEFCNYGHIADQNIHLNVLAAINTVADDEPPRDLLGGDKKCNNCRGEVELDLLVEGATSSSGSGDQPQQVVRARQYGQGLQSQHAEHCGKVCIHKDSLASFFAIIHAELNRHTFDAVLETKGSISAEHGVGQQKVSALVRARSPEEVRLMRLLKRTLDPNGILNPGKVLAAQE